MQKLSWREAAIPVPPPSRRHRPGRVDSLEQAAARLVHEIADVLSVLSRRSPADFRPLPALVSQRRVALSTAFGSEEDPVPATLLVELAPLLGPRLSRLAPRLRRRLGRNRVLQPLGRLREQDPACVRRNARLPGRTLIEKAGPRQQLLGVKRVPRFDTTENRILVAACRLLERECGALLAPLPTVERRGGGRAAMIRDLRGVSAEVLARPELERLGPPRPGERPSNALLGDADYRAAWRAWRLLRQEEARFVDDWSSLDAAWDELLELAVWAVLDARDDLEPLPAWVRVRHDREDGRRLESGDVRRWIGWTQHGPSLVWVERDAVGIRIRQSSSAGPAVAIGVGEPLRCQFGDAEEENPALGFIAGRSVALAAAREASEALSLGFAVASEPPLSPVERRACSFLEPRVWCCDGGGVARGPLSAAAEVAVPDEASLVALGREATWLDRPAGPAQFWREHADLAGHLIAELAGTVETALVVPDAISSAAQAGIRRHAGPVWMVPAPVAAALALWDVGVPDQPQGWLVVTRTAAALDVAVLELREDEEQAGQPVWIRSAARHDSGGGRAESWSPEDRGALLRVGALPTDLALRADVLVPVDLPVVDELDLEVVERVLRRWKGAALVGVLAVGLSDREQRVLSDLTELQVRREDARVLVAGAWRFLERHAASLPTWKDRLPRLDLVVKHRRRRMPVTLVQEGLLVAPGDVIAHEPDERLILKACQERIRFPMTVDDAPDTTELALHGKPLPLSRDASVRVRVRYVHGRESLTASLLPDGPAPFSRLDFDLVAAGGPGIDEALDAQSAQVPRIRQPTPPTRSRLEGLRAAYGALVSWWGSVGRADQQRAIKQPGILGRELRSLFVKLRDAADCIEGTTDQAMNAELRGWLERELLPFLAWLGGKSYALGTDEKGCGSQRRRRERVGRRTDGAPKGRPPALTRDEQRALAEARSRLRIFPVGDGLATAIVEDAWGLAEVSHREALGRLAQGCVDGSLARLLATEPGGPPEEAALSHGVALALHGDPELGARMPGPVAEALLARLCAAVVAVADLPDDGALRFKKQVYRLLRTIELLASLREYGLLGVNTEAVKAAVSGLDTARALLPDEVLCFAERTARTVGDEQLERTIATLNGRYGDVAELE